MTFPAPYPADTRAKGWRLELDHERIRQSDTWAITPAEIRPWLLMLWMTAWEQTPCGSLPDDDTLIAARIGMAPKAFAKCRDKLMRGWMKADDGRLYHAVLTLRVGEMLERRRKDAERKGRARGSTPESTEIPPGVPRDSTVTDGTGTRTGTSKSPSLRSGERASAPPPGRKAKDPGCPEDVDPQLWADWLSLRRKKSAPVTATVIAGARDEAGKAGMKFSEFLRVWCVRGSQGLQAEWLTNGRASPTGTVPGPTGPDPALEKIKADAKLAAPIPASERERWAKLREAH